jgi:hypothetical protein
MIKFSLVCDKGHEFESWFANGAAYDQQIARGHVNCPVCGSGQVTKAIMAPAIASGRGRMIKAQVSDGEILAPPTGDPAPPPAVLLDDRNRELRALIGAVRSEILASTIDVGKSFPEEARKMHEGGSPVRPIRGEATAEEVHALIEEGVTIMPVPAAPEELN